MLLVRFLQSVIVICVIGIILVLFQAGAASTAEAVFTYDYRWPGATDAVKFEKPEVLRAFYSELQKERPDYYAFQAKKGTFLKIKLNVARLVGQDDFRPTLVVFGPGLPNPTNTEVKSLTFSLPAGNGLLLAEPDKTTQTRLDEPWTQAGYWERQSLVNQLPEDGTYYLAVFSRTGQSGKYALVVGDKAETGVREILAFPITWARVHYWFDELWWPTCALTVTGLALLALLFGYAKMLRRQIITVRRAIAKTRRVSLLQKRLHRRPLSSELTRSQLHSDRTTRRIGKFSRPGQPITYHAPRPAKPLPSLKQLVKVEANSTHWEEKLLLGPKWETAISVVTNGHTPTNGHKPAVETNTTANSQESQNLPQYSAVW